MKYLLLIGALCALTISAQAGNYDIYRSLEESAEQAGDTAAWMERRDEACRLDEINQRLWEIEQLQQAQANERFERSRKLQNQLDEVD